jgi:hypothetical protein
MSSCSVQQACEILGLPRSSYYYDSQRSEPEQLMADLEQEAKREENMNAQKIAIILAYAFLGWLLCFATIGIGMALTTLNNALIIHAVLAPLFFAAISYFYFRRFGFTTPLQTASIFIAFVMLMDFFVVAILINRSFDMFASLLGIWIPFALIFLSTYLTGLLTVNRAKVPER